MYPFALAFPSRSCRLSLLILFATAVNLAQAIGLTLSGKGSAVTSQGSLAFSVPVQYGGATDAQLAFGGAMFGAYSHWEAPWQDSFNVFWLGFSLPTPSVAGYDLSFRDGPDWAETAIGVESGVPDAGTFSLFETGGMEFSSGADSFWADFTFSSEIEWHFDGSLLTGSGTWAYTTSLPTAEGGSANFATVPGTTSTTSVEPVPDSTATWLLASTALAGVALLARRARRPSAPR